MSSIIDRLRLRKRAEYDAGIGVHLTEWADLDSEDHPPVTPPSRHPYVERALRVADGIEAEVPPPPSFKSLIETSESSPDDAFAGF